mmetsp:Transcript_49448/g.125621  ORF Transcript_49448/g.125621 Transcript_49448/m.125621 type:complete len:117 (+) Transcript_49448:131-481(+)
MVRGSGNVGSQLSCRVSSTHLVCLLLPFGATLVHFLRTAVFLLAHEVGVQMLGTTRGRTHLFQLKAWFLNGIGRRSEAEYTDVPETAQHPRRRSKTSLQLASGLQQSRTDRAAPAQ